MHKDNEDYWIIRHTKFKGDIRSVGNIGKDVQVNMRGYELKIQRLRDAMLNKVGYLENKSVLEIGCGIGMMAPDLVRLGGKYSGIDISNVALEKAREKCPSGTFICNNAIDYNLNTKFDIVFCTDVLVHLVKDENWRQAIRSMKNHLKDGGVIIIKEDIGDDRICPTSHVVSRSRSEYVDASANLGLTFEVFDSVPGFYCLTPLKKMHDL